MPMQYAAILKAVEMLILDIFIYVSLFLNVAQSIDCGYLFMFKSIDFEYPQYII